MKRITYLCDACGRIMMPDQVYAVMVGREWSSSGRHPEWFVLLSNTRKLYLDRGTVHTCSRECIDNVPPLELPPSTKLSPVQPDL